MATIEKLRSLAEQATDAREARWIISRWPKRSATTPQIGAITPIATANSPAIRPAHSPTSARSVTPSSWMYNGVNGSAKLNASSVTT